MAAVTLTGVRKVYDNGHVAVQSADIAARDGELLVLVGPSGCGLHHGGLLDGLKPGEALTARSRTGRAQTA